MNELDTRAERFLESIRAEGEAACAAIRTETDAEIDRQLDEARQAQQTKAEHTLHFETERARTRANRELSAARMQARAKLAAQRQQIAADAFAAARTQLATFAAGKDYAAWLVKQCCRPGRDHGREQHPVRPHRRPAPAAGQAARRCGPGCR